MGSITIFDPSGIINHILSMYNLQRLSECMSRDYELQMRRSKASKIHHQCIIQRLHDSDEVKPPYRYTINATNAFGIMRNFYPFSSGFADYIHGRILRLHPYSLETSWPRQVVSYPHHPTLPSWTSSPSELMLLSRG